VSSYTFAESFTRTHARRLAGRVTTDLRQSHVLYRSPSASRLEEYREELEELLSGGYVEKYQFGFQRDDRLVWSMRYKVGPDGSLSATGTAGGVPYGIDISGASWFNFLTFSASWAQLTTSGKNAINGKLPFIRVDGTLPSDVCGYWTSDRAYSAGGVALQRTVFRSLL
jgi:Bacterial HORMA domain family 1